jgi:hypothetical protein
MPDLPIEPQEVPVLDRDMQIMHEMWAREQEVRAAQADIQRQVDIQRIEFHDPFRAGGAVPRLPRFIGRRGKSSSMKETYLDEELFRHILNGIKEIYDVPAVIAGGAVRDLKAGCPTCKDIDVWLPISWDKFQEHQLELGWQEEARPVKMKKKMVDGYIEIVNVSDNAVATVKGVSVDLVFLEKPLTPEDVGKFPIHAQRCVWTLDNGTACSPEALVDIENKTFTIDTSIEDDTRLDNLRAKIKSWQSRPFYKDWKIAGERKAWWEKKDKEDEEVKKKVLAKHNEYISASMGLGDTTTWSTTIWNT